MFKCFFCLQGRLLIALLLVAVSNFAVAQRPAKPVVVPDTTKAYSFQVSDTTLEDFLELVTKTTGFKYSYASIDVDKKALVSCRVTNEPLYKILNSVLGKTGHGYRFNQDFINVHKDLRLLEQYGVSEPGPFRIRGKVVDEKGEALGGITVQHNLKDVTPRITSQTGSFELDWPPGSTTIRFSGASWQTQPVRVHDPAGKLLVVMQAKPEKLEEVVVKGYYKDSRRNNTGSVAVVTAKELMVLSANPIHNLLGRVPGLQVMEGSGAPGSTIVPRIRGIQSIPVKPGPDHLLLNDPLQVWNNVPMIVGSKPVTRTQSAEGDPQAGSAAGGKGIQTATSADDIESISILKDADATSIYGSRGANGVILITTRQGKVGATVVDVKAEQGMVQSSYIPSRFNNLDYVAMRREAIEAFGATPNAVNAPDLFKLDTNDYTNIPQLLAGGTGHLTSVHASLSGGDTTRRYHLSSNLYHEGSVLPGSFYRQRISFYGNHQYKSPKRRFRSDVSLMYSLMDQRSPADDPMYSIDLVPLLPQLQDGAGNLVWKRDSFHFVNPLGQLRNTNVSNMAYLIGNGQFEYRFSEALTLRTNIGYQSLSTDEVLTLPLAAQDPERASTAEQSMARNRFSAWIIEPQLNWKKDWDKLRIGGLIGATLQQENNNWHVARNAGYASDSLMHSGDKAPEYSFTSDHSQYVYKGVYARGFAGWRNRYFLNLTGRVDGSSRFGIRRPARFWGALGTAWVFSQEQWVKEQLPLLTQGKLRFSYGATGNDQLGDYTFLEYFLRNNTSAGPNPTRAMNNTLGWEKNRKAEWGLELEWKDRFLLNVNYYHQTAKDQVIVVSEPGSANPLLGNAPVSVLNSGWEFQFQSTVQAGENFRWTSSLNLTLPKNTLQRFDGLAQSAFANALVVDQSLTVVRGYPNLGVDPQTGLYVVAPTNGQAAPAGWPIVTGNDLDPQYYGGWYNEVQWKAVSFSVLFEFRDQPSISAAWYEYTRVPPGRWSGRTQLTNHSPEVWTRWQQPGDRAPLQRFTIANNTATNEALLYNRGSVDWSTGAAYLRIRSAAVNWRLPAAFMKRCGLRSANLYLKGQNLCTWSEYKGGDPTLAAPFKLPSLRMIAAGLQVQL